MSRIVLEAIDIPTNAERAFAFLQNPSNLPRWAPRFAPAIEPAGNGIWNVIRDGQKIPVQPRSCAQLAVVDFAREGTDGALLGAFVRIIPGAKGTCTITLTVPVRAAASVIETRRIVLEELEALLTILS